MQPDPARRSDRRCRATTPTWCGSKTTSCHQAPRPRGRPSGDSALASRHQPTTESPHHITRGGVRAHRASFFAESVQFNDLAVHYGTARPLILVATIRASPPSQPNAPLIRIPQHRSTTARTRTRGRQLKRGGKAIYAGVLMFRCRGWRGGCTRQGHEWLTRPSPDRVTRCGGASRTDRSTMAADSPDRLERSSTQAARSRRSCRGCPRTA